jgi:hypothetical protein
MPATFLLVPIETGGNLSASMLLRIVEFRQGLFPELAYIYLIYQAIALPKALPSLRSPTSGTSAVQTNFTIRYRAFDSLRYSGADLLITKNRHPVEN